MNEQVKKFFETQRFNQFISDNIPLNYILLEGLGVKLPITKKDIDFTHYIRTLYKKLGNPDSSMPQPWKILHAKYALLHPSPLHRYNTKWEDGMLKVFETRTSGGHYDENEFVGNVGDEMRKLYAVAHKKKYDNGVVSGMSPGKETDELIAKWWMDENKDCIHKIPRGEGSTGKLPIQIAKITHRDKNKVSLSFRKPPKGKHPTYEWYPVNNVHIDLDQFRKDLEKHGYEDKHAGSVVRYTGWESIFEPDKVGKGGGKPNPNLDPQGVSWTDSKGNPRLRHHGVSQPKLSPKHPGYINPGHKEQEINVSQEYKDRYSNDEDFRKHIEKIIIAAVSRWTGANIKYGDNLLHHVIPTSFSLSKGMNDEIINNILNDTRQFILTNSGTGNGQEWLSDDWLRIKATSGALKSIGKSYKGRAIGATSKDDDDNIIGKDNRITNDKEFSDIKPNDIENAEELLDYIRNNPKSMTTDQTIRSKIAQFAKTDQQMWALAHGLNLVQDDDDEEAGVKYSPSIHHEEGYSFNTYLQKRINEMDIVWGNKKLKPGQTLKGGIQVLGAPWSAGKKGSK